MTTLTVTPDNADTVANHLLNLDIASLQTKDLPLCRDSVLELKKINGRFGSAASLIGCIQQLFTAISEEAQAAIQQQIVSQSLFHGRKNT